MGVMVVVVVVIIMVIIIFVIFVMVVEAFDFADPGGGGGYLLEVKHAGAEDFVEIDIGIVAVDDFRFGLDGADDGADAPGFLGGDFRDFVEEDDVAEFNLLDDQALDIFFPFGAVLESFAAVKLALHPQGVHDGDDAVESGDDRAGGVGVVHPGHGADGLGYRRGVADAARLYHDVVEFP